MLASKPSQFWPYGADNQNKFAIEMLLGQTTLDPAKRTLPATIPGPAVDENGNPLEEKDPRRAAQRLDSFVPIVVDGHVAETLIQFNTLNRKFSKSNILSLTQTVANGAWRFNGQSAFLVFSNTMLLNNQHTLQSIINAFSVGASAGKPVKPISMIPILGLHPSVFETFDCGKQRTTSDTLHVGAKLNAIDLFDVSEAVWSQAIRLLVQYLNLANKLEPSHPFYLENIRDRITNDRVIAMYKMAPGLQESIEYCGRLGIPNRNAVIALAVIAAAHAIITEVQSATAANAFVKGLATGANLDENSPIHQLREQMIRDKNRDRPPRIEGIEMLAMCIRTWNYVATHKEPSKRIRGFNSNGTFPLPLPIQRVRAQITR
jgi:hypothetical protein